jgi:iron complex transport system substrate-binding protein
MNNISDGGDTKKGNSSMGFQNGDTGNTHGDAVARGSTPQRVVSLLGATTEIMYRLGLSDKLVGRSHECDYPPAVLKLPSISRPRLDPEASSLEIDKAVRGHALAGEPVYKLDDAALRELEPDLLISQNHCRVCAVTAQDVQDFVDSEEKKSSLSPSTSKETCLMIQQLVVQPASLEDCLGDVGRVANVMGVPERGRALRATLDERLERVKTLVEPLITTSNSTTKPKVAVLEWCDPIMGCGYWIPELISVAGGLPILCPNTPGGATPTISHAALLEAQPDVVIFALCGFGLTRAAKEIKSSWTSEQLQQLLDTCGGQVYVVDGNYLINRSGPRVVESAEALAEAIHGPCLRGHFGHYGTEYLSTLEEALHMAERGETTGSQKLRTPTHMAPTTKQNDIGETFSNIDGLSEAKAAVSQQLRYMLEGDMRQAFGMNSETNQQRWCSQSRFADVLNSHATFQRFLSEKAIASDATYDDATRNVVNVRVSLPANHKDNKPLEELMWSMVREGTNRENENTSGETLLRWRTEKVGMTSGQ